MTDRSKAPSPAAGAPIDARPGELRVHETPDGVTLRLSGAWTLPYYATLEPHVAALRLSGEPQLDFAGLQALDTSGAALLARLLGPARLRALAGPASGGAPPGLSPERFALLTTVGAALEQQLAEPPVRSAALADVLAHIGRTMETIWQAVRMLLGFIGLTLSTLASRVFTPRRWRMTALVTQIEQTGLDAVPIVALLTFMVGAVVAFLGATVLADFGATIYTVDLVAYAFFREFGVLLAAILLAGRTASAFTAQIGSMKANEELDALRAQGLDPIELLVLPRVLALLLTLPMLTFVAVLSGLAGGAVVSMTALDISLGQFINLVSEVPLPHFLVGLVKAPVFAFLIAVIGCLEGFKVSGSAESVGAHTTSSVVQAIFVVILLDALAALFFMEIDW